MKIENNEFMRTDIKAREIREALEWAENNRNQLREKWRELQR